MREHRLTSCCRRPVTRCYLRAEDRLISPRSLSNRGTLGYKTRSVQLKQMSERCFSRTCDVTVCQTITSPGCDACLQGSSLRPQQAERGQGMKRVCDWRVVVVGNGSPRLAPQCSWIAEISSVKSCTAILKSSDPNLFF